MSILPSKRLIGEGLIAGELRVLGVNVCLVGSTLINGAGNDEDYLVLLEDTKDLTWLGFGPDLAVNKYPSNFESWRRKKTNLIVTPDRGFFLSEVAIAEAARALVFHARNDGKAPFEMETREGRLAFHAIIRERVEIRLHADPRRLLPQLTYMPAPR